MAASGELILQAQRVVEEPVLDAVHVIRLKPFHWPVVAAGAVVGTWLGSLTAARWYFVPALAFIGMAVGMNLRTQFRLVVRTPTRVVLVDASIVDASPRRIAAALSPTDVEIGPGRWWTTLRLGGVMHRTTGRHAHRISAMLTAARH